MLEDYKKKLPPWMLAPSATSEPAGIESPAKIELSAKIELPIPQPPAPLTGEPIQRSETPLSLFQANVVVAMKGGFWGRRGDGPPGPIVLQRGLVWLAAVVQDRKLRKPDQRKPRAPARRARKPG